MNTILLVYIAGPFSGPDGWVIADNVHRAERLAREVARLRAMPMTPHSIGARMAGTETYEFWCAATMAMMLRCDAIIFTCDWETSRGARAEMAEAKRVGLPCFVDTYPTAAGLCELKAWLDSRRTAPSGLAAVVGRWPGDESDETIAAALRDQ